MSGRRTLIDKIARRIGRMKRNVFIRDDFADLGGYDQVGRVLRKLVADGRLVRLGYGIYAKAKQSSITREPMLANRGGFVAAAREALDRLSKSNRQFKGWEPSRAELDYNEGRTTQVPANATVVINGRLSRKIRYRNLKLLHA